jgi:hypothetical protein
VFSGYDLPGRCEWFSFDRDYSNRALLGHLEGLVGEVWIAEESSVLERRFCPSRRSSVPRSSPIFQAEKTIPT